ncbi:MAG: hypothetical protein JWP14_2056 [Frankiales bacterium]|nr:hypothetical protein [Frankiales bacterium]
MAMRHLARALLALLACTAAALTFWYLDGATTVTVGLALAGAVILLPPLLNRRRPLWRVPLCWLIGGIMGAYVFGTAVAAAGLLGLPIALFDSKRSDLQTLRERMPAAE